MELIHTIELVFCFVAGFLVHMFLMRACKDGTLWVNVTDPEKDIYKIEFNYPLSRLENKRIYILEVKSH